MKLSAAEKAGRVRQRLIDRSKAYSLQKCKGETARIYQRMIRAEHAAQKPGYTLAVYRDEVIEIRRYVGQCVCVTCGKVMPWNVKGMHAGHWISRTHTSTLFDEDNINPQCAGCNDHGRGMPHEYRQWMLAVKGQETIDRLLRRKVESVTFCREDLVDMRIEFGARLKAAEKAMKGGD